MIARLVAVFAALLASACDARSLAPMRSFAIVRGVETSTFYYVEGSASGCVLAEREGTNSIWMCVGGDYQAYSLVCSTARTTLVIVGPRGCDATRRSAESVVNANCAPNPTVADARRVSIGETWSLIPGSDECADAGGNARSCLGPALAAGLDDPAFRTHSLLLISQYVYVLGGCGPLCAVPCISAVEIEPPRWTVESNCTDLDATTSFTGEYATDGTDGYAGQIETDVYVARLLGVPATSRFVIRRVVADGNGKKIIFVVAAGAVGYVVVWTSDATLPGDGPWFSELTLGVPYRLRDQLNRSCDATFGTIDAPVPLRLIPPSTLGPADFVYNKIPFPYYRTRWCNFHVGALDASGRLVYPFCLEGVVCGCEGVAFATRDGGVEIPFEVSPDPAYANYPDAAQACYAFYPKCSTFASLAATGPDGPLLDRDAPFQASCFAPFLNPEKILETGDVRDRFADCFAQGAVAYGASVTSCRKTSTRVACPLGWYEYDQDCVYAFRPVVDAAYESTDANADAACSRLKTEARVVANLDEGWIKFFERRFVFALRDLLAAPHVVRQNGGCVAFSYALADGADPCSAEAVSTPVSCDDAGYFACAAPFAAFGMPGIDQDVPPSVIPILRDGQSGTPNEGREAIPICAPGSSGTSCQTASCFPPVEAGTSIAQSVANPMLEFFVACYANGGECDEGQVRSCRCPGLKAPPAELSGYWSKFVASPCSCPASSRPVGGTGAFTIDDVSYDEPTLTKIPCSGDGRGRCRVDPGTGSGSCVCSDRPEIDPTKPPGRVPLFVGAACSAPRAIVPAAGFQLGPFVQTIYGSGNGCACPSGECPVDEIVDGAALPLYGRDLCVDRDGRTIEGNACFNGFVGPVCVCESPYDVAAGKRVRTVEGGFYVDLESRVRVDRVRVFVATPVSLSTPACDPLSVGVADSLDATPARCVYVSLEGDSYWACPEPVDDGYDGFGRFVVATTNQTTPRCDATVVSDHFPPCGRHGNPFVNGLYNHPDFKNIGTDVLAQLIEFAPFGCSETACSCAPGWGGGGAAGTPGCSVGISSLDPAADGSNRLVPTFCMESTLPPRGKASPSGCVCHPLSVPDETGESGAPYGFATGGSCECTRVFDPLSGEPAECAGHGACVEPVFPYGSCSFDVAVIAADPLSSPFTFVFGDPPSAATYVIAPAPNDSWIAAGSDPRSVLRLGGVSWFVSPGQTLNITTLGGNFSWCGETGMLPVNVSYSCSEASQVPAPETAMAYVEIWYLRTLCSPGDSSPGCFATEKYFETEPCDPSRFEPPLLCETRSACNRAWREIGEIDASLFDYDTLDLSRCIASTRWVPTNRGDFLASGTYSYSSVACGDGSPLVPANGAAAFGAMDCSNCAARTIDHALTLAGLQAADQCGAFPIKYNTYNLGMWWGMFTECVPDLSFALPYDQWTEAHYRMIGSVVNDERYFDSRGFPVEKSTNLVLDDYTVYWLNEASLEERVILAEGAVTTTRVLDVPALRPGNYFFNGLYGNPYGHVAFLNALVAGTGPDEVVADFTFENRPGLIATIPLSEADRNVDLRVVRVTLPLDVVGLQLIGSRGITCCTILRRVYAGENVTCNCADSFLPETLAEGTNAALYSTDVNLSPLPNATRLALARAYLNATGPNVIIYYPSDLYASSNISLWKTRPLFTASSFSLVGRDGSYLGIFDELFASIFGEHLLPFNAPLSAIYASTPGLTRRAIDFENPLDLRYLERFHAFSLAKRRVTAAWECTTFSQDGVVDTVVPDAAPFEPWLNGDLSLFPSVADVRSVGSSGGCRCDADFYDGGFYDEPNFCAIPVPGYGPENDAEWFACKRYNELIESLFPGSPGVFDRTAEPFATVLANDVESVRRRLLYGRFPSTKGTTRPCVMGGGRALVSVDTRIVTYAASVFRPISATRRATYACTGLAFGNETLALRNGTLDENVVVYESATLRLNVVYGSIYRANGEPFSLRSCSRAWPFECEYSDAVGATYAARCTNEALFTDRAETFVLNGTAVSFVATSPTAPSWYASIVAL